MIIALSLLLPVALLLAVWAYARCYPRHSVDPADYPWLKAAETQTPEQLADDLLARMSLPEKIAQLSGDGGHPVLLRLGINVMLYKQFPNMYSGYNRRLRIPPMSFTDGPRGIVVGQATAFPIAMARGASWDVDLERRVSEAMGREARAVGANYFGGVCVNLLRHPGWGRAQETWGEDSFHVGAMAAACVQAVQAHGVMACVKHFAVNNIENSRFYVDVRLDERTLHEVFLPQFKRCVEVGAASLMSAYNRINGDFCAHQAFLLDDILRGQWGFEGFVSSDWLWGVFDTAKGIRAGMDVEMPRASAYSAGRVKRALQQGEITPQHIDRNVQRILRTKLRFATRPDTETYPRSLLACEAHRQLAQEAAEKSAVLLENRNACLPLTGVRCLAVIGDLAVQLNTGDHGSSRTSPPEMVTLLDGLRAWLGEGVVYDDGSDPQRAARLAASCEAVVIVAGNYPLDEGENLYSNHSYRADAEPTLHRGGDRQNLALPGNQAELIRAVGAAQARSVVTLVGGSAITTCDWRESVSAIVMAWYPGMMGGHALARLLSGEANFAGRLPFAWPAAANTLPPFDAFAPVADYGYYHGYTWFDHTQQTPAYAFGHGLSYTQFAFSRLRAEQQGDSLIVRISVQNTGSCAGSELVACFVGAEAAPVAVHARRLRAFTRAELKPGEIQEVALAIPLTDLRRYVPENRDWVLDAGSYRVQVGDLQASVVLNAMDA